MPHDHPQTPRAAVVIRNAGRGTVTNVYSSNGPALDVDGVIDLTAQNIISTYADPVPMRPEQVVAPMPASAPRPSDPVASSSPHSASTPASVPERAKSEPWYKTYLWPLVGGIVFPVLATGIANWLGWV